MANTLQIKRGTNLSNAGTPAAGELIFDSGNNKLYVGNGTTAATGLTAIGAGQASDAVLDDLSAINIGSLGLNDSGKAFVFDGSGSPGFILSSNPVTIMSGTTTNGLLTRHNASTATVESALTFDGSTLVLDGEARITEYLKHNGDLDTYLRPIC